jgi:hypothetical protein
MHVSYLRDLADRVLRQEYRRRGERRRAETTGLIDRDMEKAKRREEKEEYRRARQRKLKKLFREAIRLKMIEEGSIVEVSLTAEDLEEQRIERDTRRRKKASRGMDSLDAAWEASFGNNTTLSESGILGDKSGWTNMDSLGSGSLSFTGSQGRSNRSTGSQKMLLADRMFPRPTGLVPTKDESDESDAAPDKLGALDNEEEKPDPIGYVSLSARVIGLAILHVLHLDGWDRTKQFIGKSNPRYENGPTVEDIRRRIASLHERWERVGVDVVDAGVEDLVARGLVARYGKGWKAVKSRLEGLL